jgi:hypothetical protein
MTTVSTEAGRCAAPISRPTLGAPDPIQTHARAVNSLRMALHYLNQAESNVPGAGRKAVQALAAINQLRAVHPGQAANDSGRA